MGRLVDYLLQLQAQEAPAQYRRVPFGTHENPALVPPAAAEDDLNRRARAMAHDRVASADGTPDLGGLTHAEAAQVIARSLGQQRMIYDGQRFGIPVRPQPPTVLGASPSYEFNYGQSPYVGDSREADLSMALRQPETNRPYLDGEAEKERLMQARAIVEMRRKGITKFGGYDLNDPAQAVSASYLIGPNI